MIENIKARIYCKKYNIHTGQIDANRKEDCILGVLSGYYIYNNVIYYGNRFIYFFVSAQNSWYKQKH